MFGCCRSLAPACLASAALVLAVPAHAAPPPNEWQFDAADVAPALSLSPGSPSVVVGTIDSGAAAVPDLAGKVDSRWTVSAKGRVSRNARAIDDVGHGTAVASLIAANGFGMQGFGGETHVVAVRVPRMTAVAVAAALLKLDALGARIVNMSFGSQAPERPVVLAAIRKVEADGLLLVAAAGNEGGPVSHPAADLGNGGIAVGASDPDGRLAFFSNAGAGLSLLAPGADRGPCSGVLVAAPTNNEFVGDCYPTWVAAGGASYAFVAGTSFAAPEVAGIAALIWAARPGLTNVRVAAIIEQSARRPVQGWTPTMGCGLLDAGAALALATSHSDAEWASAPVADAPCAG